MAAAQQIPFNGEENILTLELRALDKTASSWVLALVGVMMMAYANWSPGTAFWLVLWMSFFFFVAIVALVSVHCRKHNLLPGLSDKAWTVQIRAVYLLAGCNWGIAACWLVPIGNQDQALVVTSIVFAAVTLAVPCIVYRAAFNLFQLPIFLGVAAGFALSPFQYSMLLTTGSLLMAVCAILISNALGDQLLAALRLSIDNKELAKRLEQRSAELEAANRELLIENSTDALTSVSNRRSLMTFARALRGNHAIILADIDHFKSYNDTFGHAEGDACLIAVAETLKMSVRPDLDMIARLGGEEFVVVLTETCEERAILVAESIRRSVSKLFDASRVRRKVTISMGVSATTGSPRKTLSMMMEEADAALYQAKARGRNRVMAAAPHVEHRAIA